MKKLKRFTLILFLFFLSTTQASAQEFETFLNVLNSVPKFFSEWVSRGDQIAKKQEKRKFATLGTHLYSDIDKLIMSKRAMIKNIDNGSIGSNYHRILRNYNKNLEDFKKTLEKSHKLSSKIGLDAIKLSNKLNFDFTEKGMLIDDILNTNNKTRAISNLNKAIGVLEESKKNIETFITLMRN